MYKYILLLVFISTTAFSQTYVNGYYRSDGTYVRGHYRSAPNNTKTDNLGRGRYDRSDYGTLREATTRDSDNDGIYNQYDLDDNNDGYSDDF